MPGPTAVGAIEYHVANVWAERAHVLTGRGDDRGPEIVANARHEARQRFVTALGLAAAHQDQYMRVFAAIDLASAQCDWGEIEVARSLVGLAQSWLPAMPGCEDAVAWTLVTDADVTLVEGLPTRAFEQAEAGIPLLEAASPAGLARAHRVLSLALAAHGDDDAAACHRARSPAAARRCGLWLEELRTAACG